MYKVSQTNLLWFTFMRNLWLQAELNVNGKYISSLVQLNTTCTNTTKIMSCVLFSVLKKGQWVNFNNSLNIMLISTITSTLYSQPRQHWDKKEKTVAYVPKNTAWLSLAARHNDPGALRQRIWATREEICICSECCILSDWIQDVVLLPSGVEHLLFCLMILFRVFPKNLNLLHWKHCVS